MTTNVATKTPAHYRPALSIETADLADSIKSIFEKILFFVKENDLQVKGKDGKDGQQILESYNKMNPSSWISSVIKSIFTVNPKDRINSLTKTSKKKLAKRLCAVNKKMSIKNVNEFIWFFVHRLMQGDNLTSVKIMPSKAVSDIIETRKKYKALFIETEKLRQEYRQLKKDLIISNKPYLI